MAVSSWGKRAALTALAGAVLLAMALDTTWLSKDDATAANPAAFSAEEFADQAFPEIVEELIDSATDITVLVPALAADPAAAGAEYGTDVGSGKFAFPVKATGTVVEADENFLTLDVADLQGDVVVRVPIGAAVSGTPVRDATGAISFSDFRDQTQFQSVANQFKAKILADVVADVDPSSILGKDLTVVGAWSTGGPAGIYTIHPVSIEESS